MLKFRLENLTFKLESGHWTVLPKAQTCKQFHLSPAQVYLPAFWWRRRYKRVVCREPHIVICILLNDLFLKFQVSSFLNNSYLIFVSHLPFTSNQRAWFLQQNNTSQCRHKYMFLHCFALLFNVIAPVVNIVFQV